MKKYRKTPTKLLQIRLSSKEYAELDEFIKRFGVTKREWILTVKNQLIEMNIVREGKFYSRHHDYAYELSHQWDKQLRDDSYCEICAKLNGKDERGHYELCRHHHWGYEGEKAFKVMILCKRCHGIIHGNGLLGEPISKLKKFMENYKTHREVTNEYFASKNKN